MRVAALIFAIIGALGGGLMGFIALDAIRKNEAEIEAAKSRPGVRVVVDEKRLAQVKLATYAMIAGIPLGVVGGVLALKRKGIIAGVLLLVTYALPFVILLIGGTLDFSDERVRPLFLFPAGFLIAALFAFFVRPLRPPARDDYDDEDDDRPRRRRDEDDDRPRRRRNEDEDDDDRPRRRDQREERDEDDDDRPRKRDRRDDEDDDRPRKRDRRDEEDDDRPRRR